MDGKDDRTRKKKGISLGSKRLINPWEARSSRETSDLVNRLGVAFG